MNILSVEISPNWSWSLSAQPLFNILNKTHNITRTVNVTKDYIKPNLFDVYFLQHIYRVRDIPKPQKAIARLPGYRSFDEQKYANIYKDIENVYGVIATNTHLYNIAKPINPRTYIVPNSLDLNQWPVCQRQNKHFTVGFCGNISSSKYQEYKGYYLVMEACRQLGIHVHTAFYKINQIEYNRMIPDFYSKIDVLIHPTTAEGSSNCIMEALAVGVPIITTKTAGYHGELLKHENNVLFCERTVDSIIKQITKLKKSSDLRKKISENGREFAIKHHDVNVIAQQYENIFQQCYNDTYTQREPNALSPKTIEQKNIQPTLPIKKPKSFIFPKYRPKW